MKRVADMRKALMTIELEYDADIMHGDDQESVDWFYSEILSEEKGMLILHSNEIGDVIGTVRVLSAALLPDSDPPIKGGVTDKE